MMYQEVQKKIVEVLEKEILQRSISEISADSFLGVDGLGLESLQFLKLLTSLENEFGIVIEDEYWNFKKLNTIGNLVDYFHERL